MEVFSKISSRASTRGVPHLWVLDSAFGFAFLALTLLVTRVFANHHDVAVATNHLALVTNRFHTRANLHFFSPAGLVPHGGGAVPSQFCLFVAVDDPATRQVVGAELHDDAVLGKDADVVLPHFSRNVG